MRAVNLLPPDHAARRPGGASSGTPAPKSLLIACGAVGVLVVGGLAATVWTSNSSVSSKSKQLAALQTQIVSIPSLAPTAPGGAARQSDVTGLVSGRLAWDEFLTDLSKVMPEDVWLQNLQATVPGSAANLAAAQAAAAAAQTPATGSTSSTSTTTTSTPAVAPPAPSTFTVTGFTYSQPSVARMMRRLEIVPWLTGLTLVTSAQTTIGNSTVYQFTVKGAVAAPGSPGT
jgi:Tfp pilus assembly protein PilN